MGSAGCRVGPRVFPDARCYRSETKFPKRLGELRISEGVCLGQRTRVWGRPQERAQLWWTNVEPTVSLLLSVHVSPTVPPTPNCLRPGEKDSVTGHPWPNPGFPPRRRGRYAFPWPACHIPGALSAAAAPSPGGRPLSQASPWAGGWEGRDGSLKQLLHSFLPGKIIPDHLSQS